MNDGNKFFKKLKEYFRLNKPFFIFIFCVFLFMMYANDKFRATFTSIAQMCTGIGAIIALYSNIRQIDRQNLLDEERIAIKRRRKIFVSIIDEYLSANDDKNVNVGRIDFIIKKHNINKAIFDKICVLYKEIERRNRPKFEMSNNVYHGQYDDELEMCFL